MGRRAARYDLTAARREYVAAVGQVQQALTRFHAAGVPLSTETGQVMQPWSREQIRAVVLLRDAWVELARTRQVYERLLRDELQ